MTEGFVSEQMDSPWFVIWTQARAEKKVTARIDALGLSSWLPTITERRRWSDRWKEVTTPIFPGYLFARGASVHWHEVLRTPGVLTVVKEGGQPALLKSEFVAQLQQAIARGGGSHEGVPPNDFREGDEVIVQEGPLRGLRGIVRHHRSNRQLVIWIAAIGRGLAVTIGSALVSAAEAVRSSAMPPARDSRHGPSA